MIEMNESKFAMDIAENGRSGESDAGDESEDPSRSDAGVENATQSLSDKANKILIEYMCKILEDDRQEAGELRKKQRVTYWFLVGLSTLMFLTGLALITAPLWFELLRTSESFRDISWAAVAIGLGVVDLYALYQLKPLARIQKLMSDMSQMTVAFNSFQIRVALRLLESDTDDRETVGKAADHVEEITTDTLDFLEKYFEKWLSKDLNRELQTTADGSS